MVDSWKCDQKNERLSALLQAVDWSQYDVVAFQEIMGMGSWRCHFAVAWFKEQGFLYSAVPTPPPWYRFSDGGLLLVSRIPILHTENCPFQTATHIDRLAAKGFQHVVLNLGDHIGHVVNAHFQSGYKRHDILVEKVQCEQAHEIRRYLDNHIPQNEPLWIVGDLNISYQTPLYDYVINLWSVADSHGRQEDHTLVVWWDSKGHEKKTSSRLLKGQIGIKPELLKVDHIFFRGNHGWNCKYACVDDWPTPPIRIDEWSDHRPVFATFVRI